MGRPSSVQTIRSPVTASGATVGLIVVLLVLTAFAASAPFVTARAVEEVERSTLVSELSDRAEAALANQEALGDELVDAPGDVEVRADYEEANSAARQVLTALVAAEHSEDVGRSAQMLEDHDRYSQEMERMFAGAQRGAGEAEQFETEHVDPHYDALQQGVAAEAAHHWSEARHALGRLAAWQRFLLFATPAVFGMGLILVAVFARVLKNNRREIDAQAALNRHQALHDALTGLPNRTLLRQRAEAVLERATAALLVVDLDRFKEINDGLGHQYGDLVLTAIAARVQGVAGTGATAARLGGDEFAVLLPDVADIEQAVQVAHAIRRAVTEPIEAGGLWLDVDASIGVAFSGTDRDANLEKLMHRADMAMYAAKESGVGVCRYDAALDDGNAPLRRQAWPAGASASCASKSTNTPR